MRTTIITAAMGAVALIASSTAALANSEAQPGSTTGIAIAPLPEGVYFIDETSLGSRPQPGTPSDANSLISIPIFVWSTPWQIAGGRLTFDAVLPYVDSWTTGAPGVDSWYNQFLEASLRWNFGNGWNLSVGGGAILGSDQTIPILSGNNYTAGEAFAGLSYIANGWLLAANGFYGSGGPATTAPIAPGFNGADSAPSWFNLDLTATKKLGKFEVGAVAYGNWDLSSNKFYNGGVKQSQFAVGGLVGYDFGSFVAQAKMTGDVAQSGYGGDEVRGWLTIIKPLWNPESAPLK